LRAQKLCESLASTAASGRDSEPARQHQQSRHHLVDQGKCEDAIPMHEWIALRRRLFGAVR
jgi:hypothetical protein